MKTKVALIFGGKSVEHEISVISGIQALKSMNEDKYDAIPVYMTKEKDMYIVANKEGLRFAVCAVSEEKCKISPKLIKDAMDEINN